MENKNITKPLTLIKEDFSKTLIQLTNESGLPLLIVEYILKDFLNEVHMINQQQTEADRQKYEKELRQTGDSE